MSTAESATYSAAEVERRLHSNLRNGLTWQEALSRSKIIGFNELRAPQEDSTFKKYVEQFKNPLILLLLGESRRLTWCHAMTHAMVLSLQDLHSSQSSCNSSTTPSVSPLRLSSSSPSPSSKNIGRRNLSKSSRSSFHPNAIGELTQRRLSVPPLISVDFVFFSLRENRLDTFLARNLVPGDVVYLSVGDRVPADIRLFDAIDLAIDESSFTGETEPSRKSTDVLAQVPGSGKNHSSMRNIAFMGTLVRSGHGKGIVVSTGEQSEFGEVFKMMQAEEAPKTPLQKSMDILGAQLSFYSFCIIGIIMLLGWLQGKALNEMFTISVSLAVAAIPEGLPIVVTVTLALGVMRMAKRNCIVKKLPTVETLGCVNVICSDKTGTITKNEMTVTTIISADGYMADVTGAGYNDNGEIHIRDCANMEVAKQSINQIIEVGAVCNNAVIQGEVLLGTPTEGALLAVAMKNQMYTIADKYIRTKEYPFSSEQKMMAVSAVARYSANNNKDEWFFVKGAIEMLLPQCTKFLYNGQIMALSKQNESEYLSEAYEIGRKGLRVLALAKGKSLTDLVYLGLVGITDPPRPLVRESIEILNRSGVRVKMVTGDSHETAVAIGEFQRKHFQLKQFIASVFATFCFLT